jgi:hypothetical protein
VRHHREKHEVSWCMYCHEFKWGRPYLRLLREHLERQHPDVDSNAVLEAIKMNGHRAIVTTTYQPQESISLPTFRHDRRVRHASQLYLPISPPSAVTNHLSASRSAFPLDAYDPQFEFTEPVIMKSKRGNSHQFEAHNSYARSNPSFLFTEEHPQVLGDTNMYASVKTFGFLFI